MMREIKFQGRGGQGVVMASQMLGLAFFKAEMYPQCYSLFGGERRGAPVVSFLRVDKEKIFLKCEIKRPNELICFDQSLMNSSEVQNTMHRGSRILVSTVQSEEVFPSLQGFTVGLINASSIAGKLDLGRVINTAVLGAYCKLAGSPLLEHVLEAVDEMVPAKKEANREAVKEGYANLKIVHVER
jgi:2-oxoacid:acceptor oxidoreductase gamma subunit (pyruvate/2-ketoisovalerate family)